MATALPRRAALSAPFVLAGRGAEAQGFPTRPVVWVVPAGPGGITDTGARIAAPKLGALLGQPVVVENRPGAGGIVGTESVARAAPDGHTMLYGSQNTHAVAPAMQPGLRYDPQRDFAPVHGLGASPNLLVTGAARPWRTVLELVEEARRRPDALSYASTGVGTSSHLLAVMLQGAAGIGMTHVPYANPAGALQDVIAGRVDAMFDFPLTSMPHVREGRLRALGLSSGDPVPIAPGVPSLAAAGVPGVELVPWAALFVPARTPPAAVARLEAAAKAALKDPAVREYFEGTGTVLWDDMGAEALGRFLADEIPKARDLVVRSGAARSG
ncbi:tripartite tricarboxylate transporter substrate binding protein BugE [Craurococcus roseus]|uniref:Tripartite tricarboxylate transporter substrate binding protein BugE n=1 Tax=Craurococcus roseus TaxID=77585 RepID=A0ABN1FEG9_9PROT